MNWRGFQQTNDKGCEVFSSEISNLSEVHQKNSLHNCREWLNTDYHQIYILLLLNLTSLIWFLIPHSLQAMKYWLVHTVDWKSQLLVIFEYRKNHESVISTWQWNYKIVGLHVTWSWHGHTIISVSPVSSVMGAHPWTSCSSNPDQHSCAACMENGRFFLNS